MLGFHSLIIGLLSTTWAKYYALKVCGLNKSWYQNRMFICSGKGLLDGSCLSRIYVGCQERACDVGSTVNTDIGICTRWGAEKVYGSCG